MPVPTPSAATIHEQAIKALPKVQPGSAPPDNALVNDEVPLWVPTPVHRDLGTVTVVGRPVRVRADFAYADWNFGDSKTDRDYAPETPWDPKYGCLTQDCPDDFGHTYLDRGTFTLSVTITWHGEYSLDQGRTWQPLDSPITGSTSSRSLTVKESHAVLIPDH